MSVQTQPQPQIKLGATKENPLYASGGYVFIFVNHQGKKYLVMQRDGRLTMKVPIIVENTEGSFKYKVTGYKPITDKTVDVESALKLMDEYNEEVAKFNKEVKEYNEKAEEHNKQSEPVDKMELKKPMSALRIHDIFPVSCEATGGGSNKGERMLIALIREWIEEGKLDINTLPESIQTAMKGGELNDESYDKIVEDFKNHFPLMTLIETTLTAKTFSGSWRKNDKLFAVGSIAGFDLQKMGEDVRKAHADESLPIDQREKSDVILIKWEDILENMREFRKLVVRDNEIDEKIEEITKKIKVEEMKVQDSSEEINLPPTTTKLELEGEKKELEDEKKKNRQEKTRLLYFDGLDTNFNQFIPTDPDFYKKNKEGKWEKVPYSETQQGFQKGKVRLTNFVAGYLTEYFVAGYLSESTVPNTDKICLEAINDAIQKSEQ